LAPDACACCVVLSLSASSWRIVLYMALFAAALAVHEPQIDRCTPLAVALALIRPPSPCPGRFAMVCHLLRPYAVHAFLCRTVILHFIPFWHGRGVV
jgi:hypothetical protein